MGISLGSMAGADSTSAGIEDNGGISSGENYVYNVDVDPGETITLAGDWTGSGLTASNAPSFGTFTLEPTGLLS